MNKKNHYLTLDIEKGDILLKYKFKAICKVFGIN